MSFLNPPAPAPAPAAEPPIENDGWFPAIDLADLRATARLDGTVTQARLRYSAMQAIVSVNAELERFQDAQRELGFADLDAVPGPTVGGRKVKVSHYLRAVYSATQADLVERFRDYDTTGDGDKAADKLELRGDALRRDVRWAISDILGIRRTTVELI